MIRSFATMLSIVILILIAGVWAGVASAQESETTGTPGVSTPTPEGTPDATATGEATSTPAESPTAVPGGTEVTIVLTDYDKHVEGLGPLEFLEGSRLIGRDDEPPCNWVVELTEEQRRALGETGEAVVTVPEVCPQAELVQVHRALQIQPDASLVEEIIEGTYILNLDGLVYRSQTLAPIPMGPLQPGDGVQLPSTGTGHRVDDQVALAGFGLGVLMVVVALFIIGGKVSNQRTR